jgi:hypothetical protein
VRPCAPPPPLSASPPPHVVFYSLLELCPSCGRPSPTTHPSIRTLAVARARRAAEVCGRAGDTSARAAQRRGRARREAARRVTPGRGGVTSFAAVCEREAVAGSSPPPLLLLLLLLHRRRHHRRRHRT